MCATAFIERAPWRFSRRLQASAASAEVTLASVPDTTVLTRSRLRRASGLLLLLFLHLAHQLGLALAHARAQLLEIQVGLLRFGEHLFLFLLHVVLHVLAEHREGGVVV